MKNIRGATFLRILVTQAALYFDHARIVPTKSPATVPLQKRLAYRAMLISRLMILR